MLFRKSRVLLYAPVLAISVLTAGCRPHHDHHDESDQPAQTQPAQNETVIYSRWEVETHRPHKDLNQRPPEEQKEYQDWRQQHPDHH